MQSGMDNLPLLEIVEWLWCQSVIAGRIWQTAQDDVRLEARIIVIVSVKRDRESERARSRATNTNSLLAREYGPYLLMAAVLAERLLVVESERLEHGSALDREEHGVFALRSIRMLMHSPRR